MAKYVMQWTLRNGASAAENEQSAKRSLSVFSNWTPSEEVTFVEFLGRVDGEGGFAVVEADGVAAISGEIAKFNPYFEFHIFPVLDVAETAALSASAIEFWDSVG